MNLEYSSSRVVTDQNFAEPIIPRFSSSKNSSCQAKKPQGYKHIRMKSKMFQDDKVLTNSERTSYSQYTNNLPKMHQNGKQKASSFSIEQKGIEKIQPKSHPRLLRRPMSCYQGACLTGNDYLRSQPAAVKDKFITPFDLEQHNMEKICSKMAQSIILSSDTLDSFSELPPPPSIQSFERIKFLGQGKFGQVYLVKHKLTGFLCALKMIDKKIVKEEKMQSQIAKQLRIQSQLRSLNVIQLFGFFDDDKYFYILLEYATQGSVFSKLKGRSRLQQSQIQPIAKGVCDGLRFIHKMGFVHRDIKPQNIVLQFGVPKICDFGWSTYCDELQMCKSYCGTPLYISPEMIRKQFYGTSVDIWAVGLVVYELIVGRGPFRIWNQQDMNQILTKSIQFPQYIDRSQNCQSFIRKCLQKQKYNRIQVNQALRHPFINEIQKSQFDYQFFERANKLIHDTY